MSLESKVNALDGVIKSVTSFIESVRKGPLIVIMLLLAGQNVYQLMNTHDVTQKLNDCQDARIKDKDKTLQISQDLVDSKTRETHLVDSINRMYKDQILILQEALKRLKK